MPVSTKVETTEMLYTGGDSLQLPPPVQTPMNEDWRGKVKDQKPLVFSSHRLQ